MTGPNTPLAELDLNAPVSPSASASKLLASNKQSKTFTASSPTKSKPSASPRFFRRASRMDESGRTESQTGSGTYRSPSDVASPITQKITAMKTKRIARNNLKQRSLFASTVSSQHLKQSQPAGDHISSDPKSPDSSSSLSATAADISNGAVSQSDGSMADDELDGGVMSDRSEDTIILKRRGDGSSEDESDGGPRTGKGRRKHVPQGEDKVLDEGYLADESERN